MENQELVLILSPFDRFFVISLFVLVVSLIGLIVTEKKEKKNTWIDEHGFACTTALIGLGQTFSLLGIVFGGLFTIFCSGIYFLSFVFPEFN